jgi:hypothetical protein
MKLVNSICALSLAACSSGATSYLPTNGTTSATAPSYNTASTHKYSTASTQKYIYVGDAKNEQLLVYPEGVSNPSPIRTIPLGDAPQGLAVDGNGNVFVALLNTSTIDVFSHGATSLVRTITNGIYKPEGVAIDERNWLYVASHCQSGCKSGYVAEFKPDSDSATAQINAPPNFAIEGVAVHNGVVFIDIYESVGGFAQEYVSGRPKGRPIALAACAGLALDNAGTLYAANGSTLSVYAPPSYAPTKNTYYGAGIHLIGRGNDGTIYVPSPGTSPSTSPSVVVLPTGSQSSYVITAGLANAAPFGVGAD